MSVEPGDKPNFDDIISGTAAKEEAKNSPPLGDLTVLAERLDLLTADFGRWEEYKAASAEYAKEFTRELKWVRIIHACVAVAAAAIVLFFCVGLVIVLCWAEAIFGKDPSHALTALIIAAIGGTVVITVTAIKGVFGTTVERNEGLPMPEHLKEVVEVAKGMFGKG